jgi:hypothetical protein
VPSLRQERCRGDIDSGRRTEAWAAAGTAIGDCGARRNSGSRRGNAVFLLVAGKAQRSVGAELRGTGPRAWRGMAPGTRKDLGYFWIGAVFLMREVGRTFKRIVFARSRVDGRTYRLEADLMRPIVRGRHIRAIAPYWVIWHE